MPQTIPYDPSLVLGNIVEPQALVNLLEIANLQAPVDAAHEKLNSYISMKRSIDMTVDELITMKIDPANLKKKSNEIGKQIEQAAVDYAQIRIEQEEKVQPLRAKRADVSSRIESPIDYNSTQFMSVPLAADSIKLDSQYFSFDGNEQSAATSMENLKGFVSFATSYLGIEASGEMSTTAVRQVSSQRERHKIDGTLVIAATCTHQNARVLAPFILDVDKAIRVWNKMFPNNEDKIKVDSIQSMQQIAAEEGTSAEKSFRIISGATFGSSFVAMVHFLQIKESTTSQTMRTDKIMGNFQAKANLGAWFSSASGGFGMDKGFSDDIKNLMSSLTVSTHISLVTMGCIPSIKSNALTAGLKKFAEFDGKNIMKNLNELNNSVATDMQTMDSAATAARTGAQLTSMKSAQINGAMIGLADIDKSQNKVLDITTVMNAFEEYVTKITEHKGKEEISGVPVNYFLKDITRAQLAQMWMNKYYPNKYLAISGDDTDRVTDKKDESKGESDDD